jgi:predicted CopG family antitoxin
MKKHSSITIDTDTYNKLKKFCDENAYSISKYIKKLILEKLNDKMSNM